MFHFQVPQTDTQSESTSSGRCEDLCVSHTTHNSWDPFLYICRILCIFCPSSTLRVQPTVLCCSRWQPTLGIDIVCSGLERGKIRTRNSCILVRRAAIEPTRLSSGDKASSKPTGKIKNTSLSDMTRQIATKTTVRVLTATGLTLTCTYVATFGEKKRICLPFPPPQCSTIWT